MSQSTDGSWPLPEFHGLSSGFLVPEALALRQFRSGFVNFFPLSSKPFLKKNVNQHERKFHSKNYFGGGLSGPAAGPTNALPGAGGSYRLQPGRDRSVANCLHAAQADMPTLHRNPSGSQLVTDLTRENVVEERGSEKQRSPKRWLLQPEGFGARSLVIGASVLFSWLEEGIWGDSITNGQFYN